MLFILFMLQYFRGVYMKEKLIKLLNNSYSPYSKYRVSAICVMNDGKEFNGVNVENASYGATICAERSAILNAISNGYKKGDFKEIHIMADSNKLGSPCFICRQVISELFDKECKIIIYSHLEQKEFKVNELCPYPFNEEML